MTMETANGFQRLCRIDNYGHAISKEWFRGILSQMSMYLTLLPRLGLIKINEVSANFHNPRPSLILNN